MGVPPIDPLPTPPARADAINFASRADAFFLALVLFAAQANAAGVAINAATSAAAASAASAINSPGTSATSATAITLGTGNKTFAVQAGKAFVAGQFVTVASTASPNNYLVGQITAYDAGSGSMTVAVLFFAGAGTFNAWTVGISSPMQFMPATAADVWAGTDTTRAVTAAAIAAAAAPVALVDAATITPDLATGLNFTLTLGGNRTLANPANPQPGDSGLIVVTQDATGSRSLAYGAAWKFPGGAPALSTAAGTVDVLSYFVVSSSLILTTIVRSFR